MKGKVLGQSGESLAVNFLLHNGYKIVARNYTSVSGEIDIIASIDKIIVFVEVKTRTSTEYGLPCEAITRNKIKRIRDTAKRYLHADACLDNRFKDSDIRMDVIEILIHGKRPYIHHIENAF